MICFDAKTIELIVTEHLDLNLQLKIMDRMFHLAENVISEIWR